MRAMVDDILVGVRESIELCAQLLTGVAMIVMAFANHKGIDREKDRPHQGKLDLAE